MQQRVHICCILCTYEFFFFLEMNIQSFYSNLKYVNEIDNPLLREVDNTSDSEDEWVGNKKIIEEDVYISATDESSSDDRCEEPSTSKAKPKPKNTRTSIWKRGHLPSYSTESFPFEGNVNLPTCINELEPPADFFKFFFTDDLMNFLDEQSNLYALHVDINRPANITRNEVEQFIGMVIYIYVVVKVTIFNTILQ